MARTLWLGIALAVAAGAAVALFRPWASPAAPATTTETSGPAARTTSAAAASAATAPHAPGTSPPPSSPAARIAPPPADGVRRNAGYDRYRAELQRIRAAREQAQALQANERCIAGQRFRKRGTEWEQAGGC